MWAFASADRGSKGFASVLYLPALMMVVLMPLISSALLRLSAAGGVNLSAQFFNATYFAARGIHIDNNSADARIAEHRPKCRPESGDRSSAEKQAQQRIAMRNESKARP